MVRTRSGVEIRLIPCKKKKISEDADADVVHVEEVDSEEVEDEEAGAEEAGAEEASEKSEYVFLICLSC